MGGRAHQPRLSPSRPKFSGFHAFFETFGKIICWHTPKGWRPLRNAFLWFYSVELQNHTSWSLLFCFYDQNVNLVFVDGPLNLLNYILIKFLLLAMRVYLCTDQ